MRKWLLLCTRGAEMISIWRMISQYWHKCSNLSLMKIQMLCFCFQKALFLLATEFCNKEMLKKLPFMDKL